MRDRFNITVFIKTDQYGYVEDATVETTFIPRIGEQITYDSNVLTNEDGTSELTCEVTNVKYDMRFDVINLYVK